MAINFMAVQELARQYNDDPRSFSDSEAEMIANLTQQFGLDFQRTSRPGAKAVFDAADMATFGLIPNRWRPESRGDTVLGESGIDEVAGGAGTLAGLAGAGGVLKKGVDKARSIFSRAADDIVQKTAEGVQSSPRGLLPAYEGGGSLVPSPRLLGQGGGGLVPSPRLLGPGNQTSMLQLTGRPMRSLNPNSRKAIRRNQIADEQFRRMENYYLTEEAWRPNIAALSRPRTIGEKLNYANRGFGNYDRY